MDFTKKTRRDENATGLNKTLKQINQKLVEATALREFTAVGTDVQVLNEAEDNLVAANHFEDDEDDGEGELNRIRERRLTELRKEAARRSAPPGVLEELVNEGEVLRRIKDTTGLQVIHIFKSEFEKSHLMELWLQRLARLHGEAHWFQIKSEKCPFLAPRFDISVLPALIVFKDGEFMMTTQGLDIFKGDEASALTIAEWFATSEMLVELKAPYAYFE